MLTDAVPVVSPDIILLELAAEMAGGTVGMAVIVDEAKRPIGVVTKGQLGVALRVTRRLNEVTARQCMTSEFDTIDQNSLLDEAIRLMRAGDSKFLLAVDSDGQYRGFYRQD